MGLYFLILLTRNPSLQKDYKGRIRSQRVKLRPEPTFSVSQASIFSKTL